MSQSVADAKHLPLKDSAVTGVVIKHVPDAQSVVGEIERVLEALGKVYLLRRREERV